ncbi:MAG: VOC family protein [Myxococcota bacterium]
MFCTDLHTFGEVGQVGQQGRIEATRGERVIHIGTHLGTGPRPMNQVGLTHLSFLVDELDAVLAKLRALGATVLEKTRLDSQGRGSNAIFVTDPDGTRIERVEGDFDPAASRPRA